jgi:hypothetical protein
MAASPSSPAPTTMLGTDISKTEVYRRVMQAPHGQFVAHATLDNTRRFFTYSRIAGTSLISSVSFAVADIEAAWWRQTRPYVASAKEHRARPVAGDAEAWSAALIASLRLAR